MINSAIIRQDCVWEPEAVVLPLSRLRVTLYSIPPPLAPRGHSLDSCLKPLSMSQCESCQGKLRHDDPVVTLVHGSWWWLLSFLPGPGQCSSPWGAQAELDILLPSPAVSCCWRIFLSSASPDELGRACKWKAQLQSRSMAIVPVIFTRMH